ncbi:MAG TPA: PEP-CTERM sorting domain-containing protein [Telluria sp.]
MKTLLLKSLVIVVVAAAGHANAAVVTVTPADMTGPALNTWYLANYRGVSNGYTSNTTAAITATNPRSGNGSVEMSLTNSTGKADFVYTWGFVGGRTLGNLDALSYDWFRASGGTAAGHLQPAMRLSYDTDGDSSTSGDRGYLIWEQVYNGGGMVTNTWNTSNILGGNFWQRQFVPTGYTVENYDTTLAEWMTASRPADGDPLTAATAILGIEFGIGSGWNGTFNGFVDNVTFGFSGASTTFNFETAAAADVPEPASALLVGLGLLGFAGARRRRKQA